MLLFKPRCDSYEYRVVYDLFSLFNYSQLENINRISFSVVKSTKEIVKHEAIRIKFMREASRQTIDVAIYKVEKIYKRRKTIVQ